MDASTAVSNSSRFLKLPLEVRYRIYDFAFHDARFIIYETQEPATVDSYAKGFPMALTATCHLLQTEVRDYVTHFMACDLALTTPDLFAPVLAHAHNAFPRCYLARVQCLATRYNATDRPACDALINTGLPNLNLIAFDIDTNYFMAYNATELEHFHGLTKTSQIRALTSQVPELLRGLSELRGAVDRCQDADIKVCVHLRVCIGTEYSVVRTHYCVTVPGIPEQVFASGKTLDESAYFSFHDIDARPEIDLWGDVMDLEGNPPSSFGWVSRPCA